MSQAEYARHRGVSREAVRKAVTAGRIPVGEGGRIDPAVADKAWALNSDPSAGSAAPRGAAQQGAAPRGVSLGASPAGNTVPAHPDSEGIPAEITYAEARAMREYNQALLLEQQRRQRAAELVERSVVEDAGFHAARVVRDRLLALPDALDADLAALSDRAAVNARLLEEVRRVTEEFTAALSEGVEQAEPEEAAS